MSTILPKLPEFYSLNPKFKTGEKLASGRVKTPMARASFVHLFHPQKPIEGATDPTPKYGIVLLFPPDADLTLLKELATAAAIDKFGADVHGKPKLPSTFRSPFRDQGEKTFAGYVEGCKFISLNSKDKPGLVDRFGHAIDDETMFYSGCWCQVSVDAYGYDKAGNKGVSFGLGNTQKICDDDALNGRPKAESEFAAVAVPEGAGAPSTAAAIFD